MADPQASAAHASELPIPARYPAVTRVLARVLLLNVGVALAKILFGYATGAISILSDGFHSLTDGASNVVGMIGVFAAGRPADAEHPYGHRKYETVAAAAIAIFLLLIFVEVLRNAWNHLVGHAVARQISVGAFIVMIVTVAINVFVVWYETREGNRLSSEVLLADAMQTRGDIWTSCAVIVALTGARAGMPILDPIAALVVAAFIAHAGIQIGRATTRILSDRVVMSEEDLHRVVMSVPGVLGCHQIRTRGAADHVFLDLHVWLPGTLPLKEAHELSHAVKDRLTARYPQIVDAVIHIEPPPEQR